VRRLESLRREREARRERQGSVRLALDAGERSGRLVAELRGVSKAYGERVLVSDLDLTLVRGDRVGLIGRNGAGKSTLLKLILGKVAPDRGTVRLGTRLSIAYFDQLREALDPERSLQDTISPGSDWVDTATGRKHVVSYLGDFLFPPARAQAPVKALSGGERNRLLLARLFAQPANLLVMDEPTNDLDIESLELLEATLQGYTGTLLLVSHDRRFLDNVVTQTLVAEGDGRWREYVGGYSDWVMQRAAAAGAARSRVAAGARDPAGLRPRASGSETTAARTAKQTGADGVPAAGGQPPPPQRLTWKEQRELEALPAELEALEAEQQQLTARMCAPDYHRQDVALIKADRARAEEIERLLDARYARWGELDARG
jgi:ATP-binding cassette subfamily F protein uup